MKALKPLSNVQNAGNGCEIMRHDMIFKPWFNISIQSVQDLEFMKDDDDRRFDDEPVEA